ncbi:MAG TPA: RDD family protein [Cyclobacteriaceae bacterium]|nr:RDD family protein [Cyclobacteriaceae bacterium]HMV10085.1 RDD family protein [Cyclobacteriaceae bacterium]HMV88638.1 RDD family protein [Cyclobacteriaceae bacterium]HMX00600.1 RDD family protein [Cyclobacteriaceae bacterium]HMX49525.1 RDD family protein [Cyclobacteriaceae bacterium]
MDEIIDTPQVERRIFHYAGFWIRVAAYLVDAILLWVVDVIVSYSLYGNYGFFDANYLQSIISFVVAVTYFSMMESSERQATIGKMAVGIKVGNEHGNRISFGNAVGRYLAKIPSAILLAIGFLMVAWDDRKQGLHDKLADTYVFEH